jgi:2'-5' RNA ligase
MPVAAATDAIRLLSANWSASPVSCAALAVFTGAPATLFVTVAPGEALVRQQAELHAALARHVESSHYRPGGWLPHITLADDLSMQRTGAALSALLPGFSGFDAVLDHVELVRFRPVKSLWHARLAPPRPTQK